MNLVKEISIISEIMNDTEQVYITDRVFALLKICKKSINCFVDELDYCDIECLTNRGSNLTIIHNAMRNCDCSNKFSRADFSKLNISTKYFCISCSRKNNVSCIYDTNRCFGNTDECTCGSVKCVLHIVHPNNTMEDQNPYIDDDHEYPDTSNSSDWMIKNDLN